MHISFASVRVPLLCAVMVLVAGTAHGAASITVGRLTLTPCHAGDQVYCGDLARALDPAGVVAGHIDIGFEWYPAVTTSVGTILAEEGGPGSSSTGSHAGYLALFGPLRRDHNVVIIDKRGTGRSMPVDCHAVRKPLDMTPRIAGECGAELGATADLYGTDLAADDVAAVLEALQTGPVDYYGDSYATYFGQALAYRHPRLFRTMVLDGAFPVIGETPWFPTEWTAARDGFELVCERSPSCAALAGTSSSRLAHLLDVVRAKPFSGTAPAGGTATTHVSVTPGDLYLLMSYAGHWPTPYRELDAAARAYLEHDDALPLLRLVAEAKYATDFGLGNAVRSFSTGLYVAVTCSDFPLLWNADVDPVARRRQYELSVAGEEATDPRLFAPFSIDDVLGQPNTLIMPWLCLQWPKPAAGHPQGRPVPHNAEFAVIPTLILSGELDSLTSPAEGALTAELLPGARQLLIPNTLHEAAIADLGIHSIPGGGDLEHCVAPIVRDFMATRTLGDVSCLSTVPPIRTVPRFAAVASGDMAAEALPGNQAPPSSLRVASAALDTAGDVVARWYVAFGDENLGLRGGRFTFARTARGTTFSLNAVRWSADLAVSGTLDWDQVAHRVTAQLAITQDAGVTGTLDLSWDQRAANPRARITGVLDNRMVLAERVAP